MNENKEFPLILVFYLEASLMAEPKIIQPFVQQVNKTLEGKNMMAFFLRCAEGDKERIETLNPKLIEPLEMEKINKIVEDIKKQFDIAQGADDFKDENTECSCGNNEICYKCNDK